MDGFAEGEYDGDGQDYSDEVDEEMEAMLYSQVFHVCDDMMDQEMDETHFCVKSSCEAEYVSSVTLVKADPAPLETDQTELPLKPKDSVSRNSTTASAQEHSVLFENVPFNSKDLTDEHQLFKDNPLVNRKPKSSILRDASFEYQTPENVFGGKAVDDSDDEYEGQKRNSNFNIEAELGIDVSPVERKWNDKKCEPPKSSDPKFTKRGAKYSVPDKDIVVVNSDSASTNSSSTTRSDKSDCELSSNSNSDSDIELLDSAILEKSSAGPTLDLNWNVTSTDRQIIERVEETKWKINDEDLKRSVTSRYYHGKKEIRCRNCDKNGHLSKVCPVARKKPTCGLCGEEGHVMKRCKSQLCFNCSLPGHRGSYCPRPKRDRFAKCTRCWIKGHVENQCPDLWRQYHMTVTSSEDLKPRRKEVNSLIYCCNCAKRGHFAHECRRDRMDNHVFPSCAFIMKYDVDVATKKKRGSSQNSIDQKSCSPHTESEPQPKRLKSSHHHSYTPHHSQTHQSLYPRGSSNPHHRNRFQNQRYYNTPHHQQKYSFSHRSQKFGDQILHLSFHDEDHEGGTSTSPHLTPFSEKVMHQALKSGSGQKKNYKNRQINRDKHLNQTGERDFQRLPWNSRKKQNHHDGEKDGIYENLAHQKRKRKKNHKKKHGEGDWSENTSWGKDQMGVKNPHKQHQQHGKFTRKHKKKNAPQLTSSSQGRESGVVTSSAGFKISTKTINCNRNYRNKQHH